MFRRKKVYGSYKIEKCPFCDKQGITKNPQGISVCLEHKNEYISEKKCICGEFLELRTGKFGPYFYCINCGNKNFQKIMFNDN